MSLLAYESVLQYGTIEPALLSTVCVCARWRQHLIAQRNGTCRACAEIRPLDKSESVARVKSGRVIEIALGELKVIAERLQRVASSSLI